MVIPVNEIEALLEYVNADLENGVQVNTSEWEETVKVVREWLSGLTPVPGDGATRPQAENCGDSHCFLCNPPRA